MQGLKSAAVPLILSFNAEQKDEVRNIAHVMGLAEGLMDLPVDECVRAVSGGEMRAHCTTFWRSPEVVPATVTVDRPCEGLPEPPRSR